MNSLSRIKPCQQSLSTLKVFKNVLKRKLGRIGRHLTKRDGSFTIYMQKDSPGAVKDLNWLPAPDGPMYVVMRIYWPKETALNGSWKPPAVS